MKIAVKSSSCIQSLTSHTTASDTTIGNLSSPLGPISSRVEDPNTISKTESQFSSNMPHLEDSTPSVVRPVIAMLVLITVSL